MNSTVKPENDIAGTATQRPLLSRDFVLLVAGQGISLFGNVMLRFAMSMWVLDETGSATIFASVLAISIVPTILLSPFGGVLADRVNRRTIMVALDAISAVLVLASAIVFATTGFHIVAIATMQVLLAVLGAFETPTVQAALPQMFPAVRPGHHAPRHGRDQSGPTTKQSAAELPRRRAVCDVRHPSHDDHRHRKLRRRSRARMLHPPQCPGSRRRGAAHPT